MSFCTGKVCLRAKMRNSGNFKLKCASLRRIVASQEEKLSKRAAPSPCVPRANQPKSHASERTREFRDSEFGANSNLCRCRSAGVFGRWSRSSWPTWPTACELGSWRIHLRALGKTHTAFGGRAPPGHFALGLTQNNRWVSPSAITFTARRSLGCSSAEGGLTRARRAADLGHLTGGRVFVVGGALRFQPNAHFWYNMRFSGIQSVPALSLAKSVLLVVRQGHDSLFPTATGSPALRRAAYLIFMLHGSPLTTISGGLDC